MAFKGSAGAFLSGFTQTANPYLQAMYQHRLQEMERKNRLADLLNEKRQTGIDEGSYIPAPQVPIGSTTDKLSLLPGMVDPTKTMPSYPSTIQPQSTFRQGGQGYMPKPAVPGISQYGPEARSMKEFESGLRIKEAGLKTKPSFDPTSQAGLNTTTTLRKEFNDIVKDFRTVREKYKGMEVTYQNAMALGDEKSKQFADQAMIIGLNKMLDPSSVVRESEYARTPEGLSAMNRMQGYYEKLKKGGSGLTNADRTDLMETSKMLYQSAENTYKQQRGNYSNIAKQYGVPEKLVLGDDLSLDKKSAKELQQELLSGQGDDDSRFWR